VNNNHLSFFFAHSLSPVEKESVMKLWNSEYPVQLAYDKAENFNIYLNGLNSPIHILVRLNNEIVGWATKFLRDQEKWFVIILSSSIHGQYIGSRLMDHIKAHESLLYGWVIDHDKDIKVNGKPYVSPLNFYLKQGFEIIKDQRLELPTLSAVKISWKNNS